MHIKAALQRPIVGKRGAFDHHRNAIANDAIFRVFAVLDSLVVDDSHVSANTAVFVEDGSFDYAAGTDANGWAVGLSRFIGGCFKGISTHDDRVPNGHVFANNTTQPNHAILNDGPFADPASVGDQASLHCRVIDTSWRKVTSSGVDRSVRQREMKRRVRRCQAQIGIIECTDGTDILPIAVKQMHLDVTAANAAGKTSLPKSW